MYILLQRTLYDGTLKLFGGQLNPVGCAVAYKTKRLQECFDYAKPRVGDNLSMSEDIYIGHYFNWKGYRSVQVVGVQCESTEPPITKSSAAVVSVVLGVSAVDFLFQRLSTLSPLRLIKRLFVGGGNRLRCWAAHKINCGPGNRAAAARSFEEDQGQPYQYRGRGSARFLA